MIKFSSRTALVVCFAVGVSACVAPSVSQRSLIETETTAEPVARAPAASSVGSLTPVSSARAGEYRGLLTGYRASRVGDTLTIVLDELTRASKDGGTRARKESRNDLRGGAGLVNRDNQRQTGVGQLINDQILEGRGGANLDSITSFNGSGASSASNRFVGTITVTVLEVLANGNMRVAGEKRLAVGAEEEVIRFGGVVASANIVRNTVLSSHVADARIEYRGAGDTDLAKRPGFLTRLLLQASPN